MTGRTVIWPCLARTRKNRCAVFLQISSVIFCVRLQVKKGSAETEPAWKGAGQKVGMQIWRIVKFKVRAGACVAHAAT